MIKPIHECETGEGFDHAYRMTSNCTSVTDRHHLIDIMRILKPVKQCYLVDVSDISTLKLSAMEHLECADDKTLDQLKNQLENTVIYRISLAGGYATGKTIHYAKISNLPIQKQRKVKLCELV